MNISQGHQEKSRLGRLLVNRGYISDAQLDEGLCLQRETGQRLGEVLVQAGWVSEKELHRVLKHQSRYRSAAALVAVVALPFQPLISFASTNTPDSSQFSESGQLYDTDAGHGLTPMSDSDMAEVSAQGADQFMLRLAAVGQMASAARDSQASGEPLDEVGIDAIQGLRLVAHTFVPILNFLDSDFSISGVYYDDSKPRFQVRDDGALKLALPERIEEIRMDNITVSGSQSPSMGNVSFHNIRFHPDSSLTIYARQ